MTRHYDKIPCAYCGKPIGGNMMGFHQRKHCPQAQEAFGAKRMQYLRTKPVEKLTFGEVTDDVPERWDEYVAYIKSERERIKNGSR